MGPLTLAVIGQAVGSGAGIAGGVLQGIAMKRAAKKQRRYLERLMDQLTGEYRQGYAEEAAAGLYSLGRAKRETLTATRAALNRARMLVAQTFLSAPYQAMSQYVAERFKQGLPEPLAQEYTNRLRAAQKARGTFYGGAPAKDEAAMLTRMAEQQRMALLPTLRQMATDPTILQMQLENQLLAQLAATNQLETATFNRLISARQSAAQIAAARTGPLAQITMGLGSQVPFSAVSPLAGGLQAASGALSGLSSLLVNVAGVQAQQQQAAALSRMAQGGGGNRFQVAGKSLDELYSI